MSSQAVLSRYTKNNGYKLPKAFQSYSSKNAVPIFSLMALGELVADKMPFIPSRISRGPLIGRAVSGALSGGILFLLQRQSFLKGAVIGSASAVMSAFVFYYLRKEMAKHVPDPLVALAEDAGVLAIALPLQAKAAR